MTNELANIGVRILDGNSSLESASTVISSVISMRTIKSQRYAFDEENDS